MADRMKKPANYKRGRDAMFEKICREEEAAGETVVVARGCISPFPCLADIYVYAGLDSACDACAPNVQKMRDLQGWEKDGEFWTSKTLAPDQRKMIQNRIDRRRNPGPPLENYLNTPSEVQDTHTSQDIEREQDERDDL